MAVFINYRREDSDGDTRAIYNRLAEETDERNLFLDVEAIGAGEKWRTRIDDTLKKVRAVVVVIGPRWLDILNARAAAQTFDSVRMEIAASLDKPEVHVIPVLVRGAPLPAADALPEDIRGLTDLNAIEVRGSAWTTDVSRLVNALRRVGALPTSRLRRTIRAAAVVAAFVVAVALYKSWKEVPSIPKDMSYSYARELVESHGLRFLGRRIGTAAGNSGIDVVIDQRPEAGSHLFYGQGVEVDLAVTEPYILVCRGGASFNAKPLEDGFKIEKSSVTPSLQMKEGSCSWLDRPLRPEEANFVKPLGFADELPKRFSKAPGGLLAFCAKSQYDDTNKSSRIAVLTVTDFMRDEGNGQLQPRISDYVCADRMQ
jgi:TIR domain